jgi:ATP-dependent helicase/nuclease subunit B
MAVQFILGRSGTGKTSYCVRAIADALLESSEQSLLFLVPEQATYQAERAILADKRIAGYHRLHILSFDRLQFLLLGRTTARPAISRIGRQMVIHKILRDNLDKLRIFGTSALLPGFAREMAATITELHQYAKSPEDVEGLLEQLHCGLRIDDCGLKEGSGANPQSAIPNPQSPTSRLSALKFADIGLIFRRYAAALQDKFIDPDAQITTACRAVAKADFVKGARLWVDGFASFTSGEMALLIELLRAVDQAYVALCVEPEDVRIGMGGSVGAEGPDDGSLCRGRPALESRAGCPRHDQRQASPPHRGASKADDATRREGTPQEQIHNPQSAIRNPERAGLFEPTARTYRDMVEILHEAKVKQLKPVILQKTPRFRDCPALAHVEQNIFRLGAGKAKAGGDIRIVSAPSLRLEIQFVARQILGLVREKGYRYCDIAVVASDLGAYEQYVRASFEDYGIPFFIDKRKPLSQHPVIELVCAALQAVTGGLAHADIFAYLKTDLVPVPSADVDTLENYCLAFGVSGRDWAGPEPWRFKEPSDDEFDENEINRIRAEAVRPLLELRAALCPDGNLEKKLSAGEFTRVIFSFLDKLKVRRTVNAWVTEAHESGDLTTADEHRQFFDSFVDIFDALAEIFEREEMTARDYFGLLASAFAQMTLAFIPPSLDQVLVGSIERSRHPNLKAIFLLGATQKQFPIPLAGTGLLTDEDRDAAEAADFHLAPSSTQSLADRQYLAYIAFTRPSRFMCVSYPGVDDKGSPIMRSHFIDELQSLFEDLREEFVADSLLKLDEVQSPAELGELLCSRLGRDVVNGAAVSRCVAGILPAIRGRPRRGAPLRVGLDTCSLCPDGHTTNDDGLAGLLHALQADQEYRPMAESIIAALGYENRASLEADVVALLFGRHVHGSATRLGTFAACPYKHFVRYLLGLRPRREFKFEPLDLGLFYHCALDALHQRLVAEKENVADIDQDRLVSLLREEIAELAQKDAFIAQFVRRSAHNGFLIDSAAQTLEECVLGLARMVRAGSFRPRLSEVAFGCPPEAAGQLGRFELPLPDGRVLALDGKIDRLDVAEIDGRKVALVIDYKRTRSGATFDWSGFYHGLDLQLPLYMLAIQHTGAGLAGDVAGALYVPIETTPESTTLAELADEEPRRFPYKARGVINGAYCFHLDANAAKDSAFYNFYVTTKDQQPYGRYATSNALRPEHFARLLDWTRDAVVRLTMDIVSGRIEARPYHRGAERACAFCEYMGVCHFDWQINDYNFLPSVGKSDLMARFESQ